MRERFWLAAWGTVIAAIASLAIGVYAAEIGSNVGDEAPPFSLPDTEGNVVSLSDYRGRPVAVVFYRGLF